MSAIPKDTISNTILRSKTEGNDAFYPIYIVSAVMGGIFLVGPIVTPRGPHQGLIRCSIMLTAFSLWLFWVTIYIAQMNPLMGPRMDNASLAWVGHCWGIDPKKVEARRSLGPPEFELRQPAAPGPPPEL